MLRLRQITLLIILSLLITSSCFAQCGNRNYNSPCGINFHAPGGTELIPLINEVETCGIGWIRVDFDWKYIETSKGSFSWSRYDAIVAAAQDRGLLIFATLAYSPAWATSGEAGVGHPDNPQDWYDFVHAAVTRYDGQHGKGLILYWGMWNEPNLSQFYTGTRSQYINEILKNGADALKAANPNAKVLGPELAHSSDGEWYYWLKDCIEQAGNRIEILTHHTYGSPYTKVRDKWEKSTATGSNPSMWKYFEPSVKEVLQYCGWFSTGKSVWMTEVGWQSGDVGETNQATYHTSLLSDWFTGDPNRSWIERVFFYEMSDHYAWPEYSFGIISLNLSGNITRKPAFTAYKDFITANPPAPIVPCKATNPNPANMATGVNVRPVLSWTAGEGATSHRVHLGTSNPPPYVGPSVGSTYNPGTLQPLTTYYWRIDAQNATGTATGDLWQFTTAWGDVVAPSVPTDVQASAQTASSIQVTWTASTDNVAVTGYKIFRDGGVVGTSPTTSYNDTGLQPETTYSYTVSAYDAGGNTSAQSSPPAVVATPPDTDPPSVPTNVQGSALSMTTIQLTWTVSTDNVGVTGYRVYRDGSPIGTNTWPNYTDTGLQSGTTYTYTVTAYDAVGNESAHSSPPTVVTTPSIPDFCSVDIGSTDINNYLSRVAFTDGGTGAVNVDGLNCRQPSSTSNQYFYFAIDDSYIYNGSVSTTYLEVCYFDDLSGSVFIEPQYDSTAGEYTSLTQVALTGTGKWKTATWTLNNSLFANRQNGGADFRLYVGPNLVKIDSVRVSKSPFADHVSVERDLGVNESYGGLSHPQHSDGITMVQLKDGVYCKKPSAGSNYFFYFNVSDAVIYDGSTPTVYLKVGYYDSPDGLITPEYDSTSGEYTPAATLNFEGTNTWKEQVWALHDVKFANRQNSSSDFRLYVGTAQNVFIDTVVISKMPFPDNEPPSAPTDLQALGITPTAIRVTWTASTDNMEVTGYRIYRNGSLLETSAATDFTDTGLSPNTTYSYSVSAFDASGNESEHSDVVGTTMAASSIASVKELADTSQVGMVSQTVTAVFDGYFYVGEIDRYSGIRIVPLEMPDGIDVGSLIDLGGTLQTVDGERRVGSAVVILTGSS